MKLFNSYWMIGYTAYEAQVGKVCVRVLRPKMYFWPYRHYVSRKWVFPRAIHFYLDRSQ